MRAGNLRKYKVLKGTYYILVSFLVLGFSNIAYAVPPGSPYSPGATLDPACAPGSVNCTVSSASGSSGEIQFVNASSTLASDANFFWDNVSKHLGIGTTTPSSALEVVGGGTFTGTVTAPTFIGAVTGNVTGNITGSAGSATGGEVIANKDATGGYSGLTLFKINFKNALNTFTSFFTNANTASRTYTFQDRDGTIADDTDLSGKQNTLTNSSGLAGALSDETGTGLSVFSNSPTLVTPILGEASASSLTTTGNVGIGTSTPTQKLDVVGFINTDSGYKQNGDTILYASSTNSSLLSGIGAGSSLLYDGIYNTALGYQSLYTATSSDSNTALGYQSLYSNTTGYDNTAEGVNALRSNTTGYLNTAIGSSALQSNTTGYWNTANGASTLYSNTTGFNNTANGRNALYSNTTGFQNTANGNGTLYSNTTGLDNTAIGVNALYSNTTGRSNTANGHQSLNSNTTGWYNTALGYQSLFTSTSTSNLTAVGYQALYANTTGTANTALGYRALYTSTTTSNHTAVGYESLYSNTTGALNTANGASALRSNTTGSWNSANGAQALYSNTTGYANTTNGYQALYTNTTGLQNVTNGVWALRYNTTGSSNTAIGYSALMSNITGSSNTALGYQSLFTSTSTSNLTAVGYQSLYSNTTGSINTAVGNQSLYSNTTGTYNTASGYGTLGTNTTGSYNTANGVWALYYNTTADDNTAVGTRAGTGNLSFVDQRSVIDTGMTFLGFQASREETVASTTVLTNSTAIGKNARVGASNSLVLGGTGGDAVKVGIGTTTPAQTLHVEQTAVGVVARFTNGTGYCDINPTTTALVCTSDATLKKDVAKIDGALNSITALRGVNFRWLSEDGSTPSHIGFLAQEVENVLPELVATDTASGKKSVNYIGFTPVLIEAVKELAIKVSDLEARVSQMVSSGLINIKDFVVETLTAKKVATDTLEMKDSVTNEVYCVKISNGEWDKSKGVCGAPANTQMASVTVAENPIVETATSTQSADATVVSESETEETANVEPAITPAEIPAEAVAENTDTVVSTATETTE